MRLTGARSYARPPPTPTMPPGLVELMEGLAKDVLKNNPENVYAFCAGHMQKLLEIRDGPGPPKKQLSLEQKIAHAQEKIRQRIRNRQLQYDGNLPDHANEDQDLEDKPPVTEIPIKKTSVTHPVVHGNESILTNDVEIFHEPDAIIATNDKGAEDASNLVQDNASKISHELGENILVNTRKLDSQDLTEKGSEEMKETLGIDIIEIPDNEAIVESVNVTNADMDSKEVLGSNFEKVDHIENISAIADDKEAPLNTSEPIVSEKDNNAEDTNIKMNDEATEKEVTKEELHEVSFTPPFAIESDVTLSHIDEITRMEGELVLVQNNIIKEELTDTPQDKIVMEDEKYDNKIESEEIINDTSKYQEIIENEESSDIQPDVLSVQEESSDNQSDVVLTGKNESNTEPKDSVEDIARANKHNESEQNPDQAHESAHLLPETKNTIVRESTNNQHETPQQTETPLSDNQLDPSGDAVTPEKSNSQVSVSDGGSAENQVINVNITEKDTIDDSYSNDLDDHHTLRNNDIDHVPKVNKELIENDDKLPEQAAYSEEPNVKNSDDIHTKILNNEDTVIEHDETPESTVVSGMDLETAAITIQKVFRTFLFSKSRASTLDDTVNENSLDEDVDKKDEPEYMVSNANLNKERRTLGISRMDTVLQTVNEEKSLSLSDDSSLSSAATTIQAHVRGFLVRNRLASNKTASSSSLVNSDGPSTLSLDGDTIEPKKTILNIHIVPERGQFMSRDESLLTSIDLPLDNSPPSSINLHPLGYDKSERRKQLKREDAVQSISPPSNNSGKLSEEVDSVKDARNDSVDVDVKLEHEFISVNGHEKPQDADTESCETTLTISSTAETVVEADSYTHREVLSSPEHNVEADSKIQEVMANSSTDEMDVITPYPILPEKTANSTLVDTENDDKPKLVHSGEFHDIVVQTQVKRSESSVVREFKNVLVYFLLWDKT